MKTTIDKKVREQLNRAKRIIEAQDKLLASYRIGTTRAPGAAIDYLEREKPKFDAFLRQEEI